MTAEEPPLRRLAAARLLPRLLLASAAAGGCSGGSTDIGRNRAPDVTLSVVGAQPVSEDAAGGGDAPLVRVPAGTSIVLNCDAHDRDGDPITYAWAGGDIATTPPGSSKSVALLTQTTETTTLVTCTVSDDRGGVTTRSVRVRTFDAGVNHAPDVTWDVPPGATLTPGGTLSLSATAQDAEKDKISFAFFASRGVVTPDAADPSQAVFTAPAQTGEVTLAVVATDAKGASAAKLATVLVR